MRILILSDIHANFDALQAVLSDAGQVDSVWCLGDLVGYGPDPNEVIELIRMQPFLVCLMGNHDAAVLGQLDLESFNRDAQLSAEWTRTVLKEENKKFLETLAEKRVIESVTLSHGSPRNPIWEYLLDLSTVTLNFDHFLTPYCFVGHTHIPIHYQYTNNGHVNWSIPQSGQPVQLPIRSILNPGSVGQPRDRDPRSSYAIFDPDAKTWELHRVSYDPKPVQKRILEAGLPRRHAYRLDEGW